VLKIRQLYPLPDHHIKVWGRWVYSYNCGGDVPKLEPRRLNFRSVDKIVRDLRRIYKENPALFDIPIFARKVY